MKLSDRMRSEVDQLRNVFGIPLQSTATIMELIFELWESEQAEQLAAESIKERMPSALEVQVGGEHYKVRSIQPVEYWARNNLDAFQGAVVKYITRHKDKGKAEDLKKVIHYTQLYLELHYGVRSSQVEFEQ